MAVFSINSGLVSTLSIPFALKRSCTSSKIIAGSLMALRMAQRGYQVQLGLQDRQRHFICYGFPRK